MPRIFLLIFLGFLLFSCATQHELHVFNQGFTETEVEELVLLLESSGFNPQINTLPVPREIRRSSIIYPPIVQNIEDIELLQRILSDVGYGEVQLNYETVGEHYYTTENIGLYLVNPQYRETEQTPPQGQEETGIRLSHVYYSECDSLEGELSLFPEGVAILEVFDWNERTNRERSQQFDGEWDNSENELAVTLFDGDALTFAIDEFRGSDSYGRFYGINLKSRATQAIVGSCDFRFISYDFSETLSQR